MNVALNSDFAGKVDGAVGHVPACGEGVVVFAAVKGGVFHAVVLLAVHVQVEDGIGQEFKRCAYLHVRIGHGEGVGIVRASERAASGSVTVKAEAFRRSVAKREAHLVAVASVEHIAVFQAGQLRFVFIFIGGDAGCFVLGWRTAETLGDVLVRRDAVHLRALRGAEGAGVVAVGDGVCVAVADEGSAGILQAYGSMMVLRSAVSRLLVTLMVAFFQPTKPPHWLVALFPALWMLPSKRQPSMLVVLFFHEQDMMPPWVPSLWSFLVTLLMMLTDERQSVMLVVP